MIELAIVFPDKTSYWDQVRAQNPDVCPDVESRIAAAPCAFFQLPDWQAQVAGQLAEQVKPVPASVNVKLG